MSRNTVRRLLSLPTPPRYVRRRSGSMLDPYRDTIAALLEQDPKMPATAVRRHLVELGYPGGITILKEYLAAVRSQFTEPPERSRPIPLPMGVEVDHGSERSTAQSDEQTDFAQEPGMNLMSTTFEIIMINRVNERLFRKPIHEMLGKKCYQEFERRTDICPHCPGVAAMATGHPHRVETRGIRDDGTKYAVRLTAYPIMGPLGEPVGFVETEKDITEQKRSEKLGELLDDVHTSLHAAHDVKSALRQALNAAFSFEGVDFGCAYLRDTRTGDYQTVAQRGTSSGFAQILTQRSSEPIHMSMPGAIVLLPITVDNLTVARLLLGSSTYPDLPSSTRAGLEGLSRMVCGELANFRAQQLRREITAEVKALLRDLPLPVWCTNEHGSITNWNAAAERTLGWDAREVLGSPLARLVIESHDRTEDFASPADVFFRGRNQRCACLTRSGESIDLQTTEISARALLGSEEGRITIVRHWESEGVEPPQAPADPVTSGDDTTPTRDKGRTETRVLVVDHDEDQRKHLQTYLHHLGCSVKATDSAERGFELYCSALQGGGPFDIVVAPLIAPSGFGGLELAGRLLRLHPAAKLILSADSPIVGFESHGLAGSLVRPYAEAEIRRALAEACRPAE